MRKPKRHIRQVGSPLYRTPYSLPKSQRRLKRYITFGGVMIIAGFVIYGIFFASVFKVHRIKVSGNTTTSAEEINKLTHEALNSTFAGNNILFINTGVLTKSLKQSNLQFDSIKITKNIFKRDLSIKVTERKPAVLWQSNTSIYVLSDDGRAIEQVGAKKSNVLPIIKDQVNLPVTLGNPVVTSAFISFVRELTASLSSRQIEVKELSVPGVTTSELYVQVGEGYVVKLDTSRGVEEQLADLDAVRTLLKKQGKAPKEYIDLRVAHKAFYQ